MNKIKALPEPGVDVFVVYEGKRFIARRGGDPNFFILAFPEQSTRKFVPLADVVQWDYAVPAGDMLL